MDLSILYLNINKHYSTKSNQLKGAPMFIEDHDNPNQVQQDQVAPSEQENPKPQQPAKKAPAPKKPETKKPAPKKPAPKKPETKKAEVKPGEVYSSGTGLIIQNLVKAGKSNREALIKAVAKDSDNAEARVNLVLYKLRKSLKRVGKDITKNKDGAYHIITSKK